MSDAWTNSLFIRAKAWWEVSFLWMDGSGPYIVGILAVFALGLSLLLLGLRGDPNRGRARCRRCGYDLRHLAQSLPPDAACPECGQTVRSQRELYRRRLGYRKIVLGLCMVMLSGWPVMILSGYWSQRRAAAHFGSQLRVHATTKVIPEWIERRLPESTHYLFVRKTKVTLDLSDSADDTFDLGPLASLRHLRSILIRTTIHRDVEIDFIALTRLPALETVEIAARPRRIEVFAFVMGMPDGCQVTMSRRTRDWRPARLKGQYHGPDGTVDFDFQIPLMSNRGLEQFAWLSGVTQVDLLGQPVGDAAMATLADQWPDLTQIRFSGAFISGSGLTHLATLRNLRELHLDATPLQEQHLAALAGSPIEVMSLRRTDLTDRGLVHLMQMPRLRGLDIRHTRVTQQGMIDASDTWRLDWLNVGWRHDMTPEVLARLRRITPVIDETRVSYQPITPAR